MSLSDAKKTRINSLSTEEMHLEVNKGNKSRFQRDSFAYLKTCYEERLAKSSSLSNPEILKNTGDQTMGFKEAFLKAEKNNKPVINNTYIVGRLPETKHGPNELSLPDKITMIWLWHNVPYKFWFWSVGLLGSAFILGVFVGQTKLYHDLTTKNENPATLINKTTQFPTTIENDAANTAAPIKNDTLRK